MFRSDSFPNKDIASAENVTLVQAQMGTRLGRFVGEIRNHDYVRIYPGLAYTCLLLGWTQAHVDRRSYLVNHSHRQIFIQFYQRFQN